MRIVMTGTAHVGKTELLSRLSDNNSFCVTEEAETPIVRGLNDTMGAEWTKALILSDYTAFKARVGDRQAVIDNTRFDPTKPVFFDRSAICYIAYCKLRNAAVPKILEDLAAQMRPDFVFFLEQIACFTERRDTGRFMSQEDASRLAGLIENEYTSRGIELIRVSEFSQEKDQNIRQRINFILERIGRS